MHRDALRAWEEVRDGVKKIVFSMTPDEFVASLVAADEYLTVALSPCAECIYGPQSPWTQHALEEAERDELLPYSMLLDCVRYSAAARNTWKNQGLPDMAVCAGYVQAHGERNPYLAAAFAADRVRFFDAGALPSLKEDGWLPLDRNSLFVKR